MTGDADFGAHVQTIHVLFATVTGNAEEIARRIHSELPKNSLPQGVLCAVENYAKTGLGAAKSSNDIFIFVAATTGDGDAPDTARPFMRFLRKKEPSLLKGVRYTVLGLGDTNYENFCKTGKRFDSSLKKLGAKSFYKRGDADDGIGLEVVVEPWIDGLWDALGKIVKPVFCDGKSLTDNVASEFGNANGVDAEIGVIVKEVTEKELGFEESDLPSLLPASSDILFLNGGDTTPKLSVSSFYDESKARVTSVSGARQLTAARALKTVWHVEVSAEQEVGYNNSYRAGDAFGMLVQNDSGEVAELITFLNVGANDNIRLQNLDGSEIVTGTVRQLLSERVDIRAIPKKTLLRALSQHCTEPSERKHLLELCSKSGRKLYSELVLQKSLSVLRLLQTRARSCRPPIALLLDQLPPLAPRWYSATSSPGLDGTHNLHFAFSVVSDGLATPALAARCEQFQAGKPTAPIVLIPRASDADGHFHPPPELSTSYIMVGPGTGVAPFRGFLRERAAQLVGTPSAAIGETFLFFGCRDTKLDYLYQTELEDLRDRGVLSTLDVAVSRAGPAKVYVQDRIRKRAEQVATVLIDGGSLFVCGDGGGMAAGVDDAVRDVLAEKLFDGDQKQAKAELKKLAEEHRYVRDIWYFG